MKRRFRLTRATDFKRVRRFGRSHAHPLVVLVTLKNEEMAVKIGITASRSVGNAVERNRSKRRLRAAIEPVFANIRPGWSVILLARRPIVSAGFQKIQSAVVGLLREAGLLVEAKDGYQERISG